VVEKHRLNQPAHEQVHRVPYSFQALENTRTTTPTTKQDVHQEHRA